MDWQTLVQRAVERIPGDVDRRTVPVKVHIGGGVYVDIPDNKWGVKWVGPDDDEVTKAGMGYLEIDVEE